MKKEQSMLTALAGVLITMLNSSLTCCICGHLDMISLPGSVIGFLVAFFPFVRAKQAGVARRIVIDACVVVTGLALFKNIGDVLWWGHSPLLG